MRGAQPPEIITHMERSATARTASEQTAYFHGQRWDPAGSFRADSVSHLPFEIASTHSFVTKGIASDDAPYKSG
jgi:hypothetical protein